MIYQHRKLEGVFVEAIQVTGEKSLQEIAKAFGIRIEVHEVDDLTLYILPGQGTLQPGDYVIQQSFVVLSKTDSWFEERFKPLNTQMELF